MLTNANEEKQLTVQMKRILLIGQCTLHWGRLEFGNLGNYAIIEPLIRELHRVFPEVEIRTTFQMTDDFCNREQVHRLPMKMYYGWEKSDFIKGAYETILSAVMKKRAPHFLCTDFMREVLRSDLVIDFSGDIWGANADLVGKNRFVIGLFKDLTAHLLGKKIVMIAGSPGPFSGFAKRAFAKYVFGKFNLVTNREEISTVLLKEDGFPTANVHSLVCPAFLFQRTSDDEMKEIYKDEGLENNSTPKVGFIVCGWNMQKGPFGRWPRNDSEYNIFAKAVEFIINELHAEVVLMSHNNGFIPPPNFKISEGRDHQVSRQLMNVLSQRGKVKNYRMIKGIYNTAQIKSIIGKFDMLVTGRIHAAVSGFTQHIPTVILDYGHEPKAHKLQGFARIVNMEEYIADPCNSQDVILKIRRCWKNREAIKNQLSLIMPEVQKKAHENFELLERFAENGDIL